MANFENITIKNFTGYFSVVKYLNNSLYVMPITVNINKIYAAIIRSIQPVPGIYNISLTIDTDHNLYWRGTYNKSHKILLKNGVNNFNIIIDASQKNNFDIGIFSNISSYSRNNIKFAILNFSVNEINKPKPIDNSLIDPKNETLEIQKLIPINKNNKNILLVADVKDWCFYNTSKIIRKYLGDKYNIFIECYADKPDYLSIYKDIKIDLVVKFWYGHHDQDPFDIYPNAKKAICIYDYIYWNENINKKNLPIFLKYFTRNLEQSNFVLFACPAIKDLIIKQINNEEINKKLYPIYDGFCPKKFYLKKYNENKKLVVGWAGNYLNPYKNFNKIKSIVEEVSWIDFKVQDRKTFIPHEEMVHYYHSVDVIVCLSDAEGTPTPILEASASGRAWISTNVGIVGLINDACSDPIKPGLIINDDSELLPCLKYLYQNKNIMKQMGYNGWITTQKEFTWDTKIKQFHNVFKKI
ncbi:glycosyltransferase [Moumouvirus maliensis]|nr:glycosyltransferase [Moumouvirus maliensis]